MAKTKYISLLVLLFSLIFNAACSKDEGLYQNLGPEEDGVVSIGIPDDDEPAPQPESRGIDQLTSEEVALVDRWHEGDYDKLSFVVVDVDRSEVLKSYFSEIPARLASVSKITTALAALENVRNVEVPKVANMLKISNNGEASRYVRLGAKALEGLVLPNPHYSQKHSCPSAFLEDEPAAQVVFKWLTEELNYVDWTGAGFYDGAGCHYDNFMSPLQVARILEYADSKGKAYNNLQFEDLLSINGKDGTWKNKNLEHKGYIFAKTGTLNPNANLSGYFYARKNNQFRKFYFSVFIQKKGGGSYSTKARRLIEELLRYWINYYSAYPGDSLGEF